MNYWQGNEHSGSPLLRLSWEQGLRRAKINLPLAARFSADGVFVRSTGVSSARKFGNLQERSGSLAESGAFPLRLI